MITPRMNFDNIGLALTTIFCEIMGEDWNVYMYTYVRPQEGYMKYMVMGYFLSLMIMGNIMLLSLFTAILLQNFEDSDEEEDENAEKFNIKSIFTRAFLIKAVDGFLGVFGAKKRKQKPETQSPRQVASENAVSQIVSASPQSGLDKPGQKPGAPASTTGDKRLDNILEVMNDDDDP